MSNLNTNNRILQNNTNNKVNYDNLFETLNNDIE